jgi:hypothetical protein
MTPMVREMDFVILVKGEHRHIFLFELGCEDEVQTSMMDCAESDDCNLEWGDVLCVIKEMQQTTRKKAHS